MLPDVLLMPGMVTAAVFVLVLLVEGARRSGYDPVLMTASELSLGERGWWNGSTSSRSVSARWRSHLA